MASKRPLVLLHRETARLLKDKTLFMALFMQLFVALVAAVLVSGVAISYAGNTREARGIVVTLTGAGDVADLLEMKLRGNGISVMRTSDPNSAVTRAIGPRLGANIKVNGGSLAGEEAIELDVTIIESVRAASVTRAVRLALEELQDLARSLRNDVRNLPWGPRSSYIDSAGSGLVEDASYAYYVFEMMYAVMIPLVLTIPPIFAGGLLSESVIEEKEKKTMLLLSTVPFRRISIYNARILIYTSVSIFQILLSLAILSWLGVGLSQIGSLILAGVLLSIDFSIFGCLVSSFATTKTRAQMVYSLGTGSLLTSGFLLPGSLTNLLARLASGTPNASLLDFAFIPLAVGLPLYAFLARRAGSEEE